MTKWRETIDDGRAWVILDSVGTTVGTVSRGPADRDFWHEDDLPETGFYMYKLITSRTVRGKGLGSLVIDWACRIASIEGRDWVRIDCWRTNTRLQRYYEDLGFRHLRTEAPAHRKSGWLAQRPSTLLLHPHNSLLIGRFDDGAHHRPGVSRHD